MACHQARLDGARVVAGLGEVSRPCEPGDIYRVVWRLYRAGRLQPEHLRVLVRYGRTMLAPDPVRHERGEDVRRWDEALARLQPALLARGIVT